MNHGLLTTAKKLGAAVLLFGLALGSQADEQPPQVQTSDPLVTLRLAVEQGQYQQAYAVAQQQLLAYEGDPSFDFYYGFSAAQTGNYQEALFVFERLISAYPDVIRYRLELARAHFYLDNLDGAEKEFRRALDAQPPSGVVSTVEQFLERIEQRRQRREPQWQAGVSLSAGYDSNINAATDEDRIRFELNGNDVTATLNRELRASDSGYYQLRGHAQYIHPLSQRSGIDVRVGASRKDNGLNDDYDLNSVYADMGWRLLRDRNTFGLSGQYRQYHLGGKSYQNELGVIFDWMSALNESWAWTSTAGIKKQNNQRNSALDLTQAELELGINFSNSSFGQQLRASFSSDFGDDESLARNTMGVNWNFQYAVSHQSQWYGMALLQDQKYKNPLPNNNFLAPGVKRDEQLMQFALGYSRQLIPTMGFFFQLSWVDSSSNVTVYEYQRSLFETGIALSF